MPAPDRHSEPEIDSQLVALARERAEFKAAHSRGEIKPTELMKLMTKNRFCETQLLEQTKNETTREKSRKSEQQRSRQRDFFGD